MSIRASAVYPSLKAHVVIITGGATGIGAEIASRFHEQGACVYVLDIDDTAGTALAANLSSLRSEGSATYVYCDVTDCAVLRSTIERIGRENGRINTLVNNAANDSRHDWREFDPLAWDDCLNINLRHHFFASQAAHPFIRNAGGGAIICMGSIAWLNGTTEMIGYTTAKAGIQGLVRTLAKLFGPDRIRVNALLPGWTMTERQLKLWITKATKETIAANQSLPDSVTPEDIARMALFLASDDARMCTKQVFVVDGGWI